MKPRGAVHSVWSPKFAYCIGLITTDGNVSTDGRHVTFVSKDRELVEALRQGLGVTNSIGRKGSGTVREKVYSVIQIGDVRFCAFLRSIGIHPNKTKTIATVTVPDEFFFDFLRGHFDGDGSFYSYVDRRWRSSFMFYTTFVSASQEHIRWLRGKIQERLGIQGHITTARTSSVYQLKYAKSDSLKLLPKLYYTTKVICLRRKRSKVEGVIGLCSNARVLKLVDRHA